MNKFIVGVCTLMEIGCVAGLAAIGLKRNNDCYKAQCELINEQCDHYRTKIDMVFKDTKIKVLEREIEELKAKYEIEDEA